MEVRTPGVCGFVAMFEPGRRFETDLLERMGGDIFHRGPDSGGIVEEEGFGLSVRRLAIIDPGAASDQPMSDRRGRYTLVFNGEIYNHRELRRTLIERGVRFRTDGDTEVLLQGFMTWGNAVLERLEGMYAFVIVDRRERRAFAARDPLGIKPLYFRRLGATVALASEIRPLRRLGPAGADEGAVAELLTFGWAAGRLSNVAGIDRVPGGTLITLSLDGGGVLRRRDRDILDDMNPKGPPIAEEEIEDRLRRSVRDHLMSDVGYNLQLSGGVDSSLVAALAQEESGTGIASYGVRLDDSRYDESPYRKEVVAATGLAHHEIDLDGVDFADALPRAVRHMEGPVPHGGCVMLMLLCDRSKANSKVILTGEGADEAFGGYLRYALWRKLAWQERLGKALPAGLLPPLYPFRGTRRLQGVDAAVYASVYQDFRALAKLFPQLVPAPAGLREKVSDRFADFRDRLLALDHACYLESLLVRQDKMSMAASVEARMPFVHLPLWRQINRLRREVRIPGRITKPVLKRIARKVLPRGIVDRRKVGLRLPYDEWTSDPAALGRYLELLTQTDCRLAAFADKAALPDVVARYRAGERQGLPFMFTLINLELWLRDLDRGV